MLGLWLGRPRRSYYGSNLSLGGFVGYNLGGTSTSSSVFNGTNGSGTLEVGTTPAADIQPLNYGLELAIGAAWRSGFFYSVKVKYGLANLATDGEDIMNSFDYAVTVGWLVGRRGQHKHIPHRDHSLESKL